jgi:tetratricopeptide (TPR) repeat protein
VWKVIWGVCALTCLAAGPLHAASTDQQLTRCLHRAEQLPDQAAAEASVWLKKGGGDQARLCLAFAQFHRGDFAEAARGFAAQAARRAKNDRVQGATLHVQAGLAAMRAGDLQLAEAQYAAALKLEPQDPEIWLDRAMTRAAAERYWDALDDVNEALAIMPDMPEALRVRAQVRVKIGQDSSARSDLEAAGMIEKVESVPTP